MIFFNVFFVPFQAKDIIAPCGIKEITVDTLKGMKLSKKFMLHLAAK